MFKLGNDGKINEFKRIIESKRDGEKNVTQQTQLELKNKDKGAAKKGLGEFHHSGSKNEHEWHCT